MKNLSQYINESKNYAKGLKAGDTLFVLPINSEDKNPIELRIVEIDEKNAKGEAYARVAKNDAKITHVYLNFTADEAEYSTFALTSGPQIEVIVGKSVDDLKEILSSKYSEQIKELGAKISKAEIMVYKMKKEMDELIKKASMGK